MEILKMRAIVQEMAFVDSTTNVYTKAISARRLALQRLHADVALHRENVELTARNKTIQVKE